MVNRGAEPRAITKRAKRQRGKAAAARRHGCMQKVEICISFLLSPLEAFNNELRLRLEQSLISTNLPSPVVMNDGAPFDRSVIDGCRLGENRRDGDQLLALCS